MEILYPINDSSFETSCVFVKPKHRAVGVYSPIGGEGGCGQVRILPGKPDCGTKCVTCYMYAKDFVVDFGEG